MNEACRGDPVRLRLAELLAASPLGVDLGFGQPMEHVLSQCMIALRLADFVGLDAEERSVVYYTALLVNVGLPFRRPSSSTCMEPQNDCRAEAVQDTTRDHEAS